MKFKFAFAGGLACLAVNANAETLVVAAPFTEFPILSSQMLDGAKSALEGSWVVKPIDAGCTEQASENVADLIIAQKPDAVIGLPCIETLNPVLAALGPLGVPIITIASRAIAPSTLAKKNQWQLYRTGPRENEETTAIAKLIAAAWRDLPFAILDDGTIFARNTAEAIRNETELLGKKPVLVDTFQPQLENQQKLIDQLVTSGATHVFIAGDRANIAQIATESKNLNLTFAGPETLKASEPDFALPAGILMMARDIGLQADVAEKITASRQTAFAIAEGYSADAYVAVQVAIALLKDPAKREYDTALGPIVMSEDGFLEPITFSFFRYDGTAFEKISP